MAWLGIDAARPFSSANWRPAVTAFFSTAGASKMAGASRVSGCSGSRAGAAVTVDRPRGGKHAWEMSMR